MINYSLESYFRQNGKGNKATSKIRLNNKEEQVLPPRKDSTDESAQRPKDGNKNQN